VQGFGGELGIKRGFEEYIQNSGGGPAVPEIRHGPVLRKPALRMPSFIVPMRVSLAYLKSQKKDSEFYCLKKYCSTFLRGFR